MIARYPSIISGTHGCLNVANKPKLYNETHFEKNNPPFGALGAYMGYEEQVLLSFKKNII